MNRLVWIDPDGVTGHDWMAVIVRARTGVSYRHQYGGTACRHGTVEGYLVPVFHRVVYPRLRALFEETLRGAGTRNRTWPGHLLADLRATTAIIAMPDRDPAITAAIPVASSPASACQRPRLFRGSGTWARRSRRYWLRAAPIGEDVIGGRASLVGRRW